MALGTSSGSTVGLNLNTCVDLVDTRIPGELYILPFLLQDSADCEPSQYGTSRLATLTPGCVCQVNLNNGNHHTGDCSFHQGLTQYVVGYEDFSDNKVGSVVCNL